MSPRRRTRAGSPSLRRGDETICEISFPPPPRFYGLSTEEGIPYWKIAQLHSRDTLATTVLQTCIRYGNSATKCQFCAIGESLKGGRTIARKTPEQLAEVAAAAHAPRRRAQCRADHRHAADLRPRRRGAERSAPPRSSTPRICRSRRSASRRRISAGFTSCAGAGSIRSACTWRRGTRKSARASCPARPRCARAFYLEAFEAAVSVFGRGQVSTYLLAGLGDTRREPARSRARAHRARRLSLRRALRARRRHAPRAASSAVRGLHARRCSRRSANGSREAGMTSDKVKAGCAKCARLLHASPPFEKQATPCRERLSSLEQERMTISPRAAPAPSLVTA